MTSLPTPTTDYRARRSGLSLWLIVLLPIACVLLGFIAYRLWSERGKVSFQPRPITARGDLAGDEKSTIGLFKEGSHSVAYITTLRQAQDLRTRSMTEIPAGTGSGIVWDDAGHIVTNFHFVQGANGARVTLWDHTTYPAELVGVAPNYDLALLRIKAPADKLRPIPIGVSNDLQVGQKVFAIGNPFGLDQTLTTGIVSALGRTITAITGRPIEDVIQTDAAVNPGNSGGPLLDSAGRLIGVNTAIYSPSGGSSGIGFAVPVDTVNRVIPQLLAKGRVAQPYLGVRTIDPFSRQITQQLKIPGLLVMMVEPDSPAAHAGIRGTRRSPEDEILLGDIIQEVDGKPVLTFDQLMALLELHAPGDEVTLKLYRDGESRVLKVPLAKPQQ